MAFCSKCGANLNEGVAFCPSCGAPAGTATAGASQSVGVGGSAGPAVSAGASPLAPNIAGLLTYVAGLITGIIFLVLEPYNKDKFVRFHAFQSIFLNVAWIVFWVGINILTGILSRLSFGFFGLIMVFVDGLLGLGFFLLWLFMMYKAYNNEKFMLPVIGNIAAQQAG